MGDDVICIDSDEDDEDDAPRRGSGRGARGKRSAGGYWRRQRRIGRARKKWNRHDASHQFIGAPQWLVEALGQLGSGMCFGPGRRNLSPETVCQVAEHLRKLVGRLQGDGTQTPHTNAEQTEGWRHVLKFLLLLRTAGREDMPTARAEFSPTRIDSKRQRLRVRQNRRYQLTVIDILVDYIRFRCESVATGQQQQQPPPASAAALLGECNSIVSSLFVVFEGDTQLVTLTLLRAVLEPRYTLLLYPVFESVLTDGCGSPAGPASGSVARCTTIPHYVGLLLCFKRWKSLAVTRADRATIERHAVRFLPTRCPTVQLASDVPFLLLLPSVPTKQRAHETRFLLANDLFDVERCIDQYVRHYRQYTAQKAQQPTTPHSTGHRHRLHRSLEIQSNYINVAVLAELIERKVRLWNNRLTCHDPAVPLPGGVDPLSSLRREASSIVESLRLIFRNGTEFSELTLLHVVLECPVPSASEPLLAAVFEAFLADDPAAVPTSNHLDRPDHPTGLAVYRSNDVETYVRLVLCYAKWKALCRHQELRGERVRIDGIALSQLPHDCPRAICPRDALLRRILYGDSGTTLASASNRSTLTGFLLRTLPDRSDLQELCFKFLDAYRSGSYATTPSEDTTQQDDVRSTTTRAAYKSATTVGGQLLVTESPAHTNDTQAAPGQPTHQPYGGPPGPEMKPIIIPDSDGLRADGISVPDRTLKPMLTRDQEAFVSQFPSVSMSAVSGSAGDVLTAADIDLAPCPPMAECFLNTPPATPQQDAMSEVPGEEDRRNVLVRRHPAGCSGRLKGTIRAIQPRKKRNTIHASTVRRTLGRPLHDGRWWSFADVLAVQSPAERRVPIAVRWWSSVLKIGRPPNHAVSNLTIGGTQLNPPQLAPNDPSGDALLLQLIDSLGDSVPSDTTAAAKQGAVDFTILADNPHDSMEHQASPSVPIDTSAIFGDGDQTVLLFTEQGPISWPIV
ncbi:uncharacterized protein LOC131216011 [Anopheles bellator]|uniref:uncharacterized protein LOC131216011 n=1 Tax=Anopheles bellator TaxID=139047 RepID=UPI00264A0B8E|nr:uncharacterized protein LOC131216011 [Anopheles bellator]